MAVRIRLTRVGATKRPSYRVVAIDRRRARDGRALEILGFYDPLTDPATVQLDAERIQGWIAKGAQPSDSVVKLMRQAGMPGVPPAPQSDRPKAVRVSKKAKAKAEAPKAAAEAPTATEAPADEAATEAPAEETAAEAATEAPASDETPAEETAAETSTDAAEAADATESTKDEA